jgi:hypothetical protein
MGEAGPVGVGTEYIDLQLGTAKIVPNCRDNACEWKVYVGDTSVRARGHRLDAHSAVTRIVESYRKMIAFILLAPTHKMCYKIRM